MSVAFGRVLPILRMFDLPRKLDFYVGYLGCKIDWQVGDGTPGPVTMRLRETLLELQYGRREDPHGWMRPVG